MEQHQESRQRPRLNRLAETAASIVSARRSTWSNTKNPSDLSDLHGQEKRESVSLRVVMCKLVRSPRTPRAEDTRNEGRRMTGRRRLLVRDCRLLLVVHVQPRLLVVLRRHQGCMEKRRRTARPAGPASSSNCLLLSRRSSTVVSSRDPDMAAIHLAPAPSEKVSSGSAVRVHRLRVMRRCVDAFVTAE